MAIKLAHNCSNCNQLRDGNFCKKHEVHVGAQYTCDSFDMKAALKDDRNCVTCTRYQESDCANPTQAAPGMLCASWAPQGEA
ncbi:hypothetical protein JM84_1734 [Dokdonia sp. Hel_I_63]|uniref:hypothetical protein n=1 Tax=unclassified Dokdonia TaxID=2615033 RepID=UPI00020A774C|nr:MULTISPECIES: hypothetical protein [unclassified Dokdonia]AEE20931.1 hypothetical protein Krodi_2957 [Dokdonia sp. 4H-3-7-5]TVZ22822.1 hypothetical protein JM84_1734 [Dokdonia sp. Hel_I_63]